MLNPEFHGASWNKSYFAIPITPEVKKKVEALKEDYKISKNYSDDVETGWKLMEQGYIAELAIKDYFKYEQPTITGKSDGNRDIELNNVTIDISSKYKYFGTWLIYERKFYPKFDYMLCAQLRDDVIYIVGTISAKTILSVPIHKKDEPFKELKTSTPMLLKDDYKFVDYKHIDNFDQNNIVYKLLMDCKNNTKKGIFDEIKEIYTNDEIGELRKVVLAMHPELAKVIGVFSKEQLTQMIVAQKG